MKKLLFLGAAAALAFSSCKKNDPVVVDPGYPTDSLAVVGQARPLVIETTGTWCQYCPNGAEIMTMLEAALGDSAVLIASHVNDYFSADNAAATFFNENFPTSGVPNFYVNNTDAGQSPEAAAGAALLADVPFDLITEVVATDTAFVVYPRVKCLETQLSGQFMIQSYLLLNGVEARDYGNGVDLNQISSVPIVTTGSGNVPTKWAQDAAIIPGTSTALIKSGTIYTHNEALFGHATVSSFGWSKSNDANIADSTVTKLGPTGLALGDINPLGASYAAGDIFGTRYTPFHLRIKKPTGLPFTPDYSVATIIWKLREDGSGDYDYINGHVSHVH